MLVKSPKVFLIGETQTIDEGIQQYLEHVGAPEWATDAGSSVELLPEYMGRICYRSWAPDLNPNVTRVRKGNSGYLAHIFETGHGSVTEHSTLNFVFADVSRVYTHELVRHRAGTAMSQESGRFVRLDETNATAGVIPMWLPQWALDDTDLMERSMALLKHMEEHQLWMAKHFGLDAGGVKFGYKKHRTSFMRRFAPIGLATTIGWSANIRAIRHVIEMRTDPAAEEEIRLVFSQVAEIVQQRYPNLFSDYEVEMVDGLPWYKTKNKKV